MSSWDPVYRLVKQIPRGRVLSYGALAKILRLRGGARSAGRAMAATPSGKGIPWHRVLGEGGKILVREPYASLQKKLLESEGVSVDRIPGQPEAVPLDPCHEKNYQNKTQVRKTKASKRKENPQTHSQLSDAIPCSRPPGFGGRGLDATPPHS